MTIDIDLSFTELELLARLCQAEAKRPGQLDSKDFLGRAKRSKRYIRLGEKLLDAKHRRELQGELPQ